MNEVINAFLKSEEKEISIDFTKGWSVIQETLLPLGYEELEGDDFEDATNGWDVDFWYTWKHGTLPNIMLSGSLHRGGFKLTKSN
jgi:hypothetical protein